MAEEKKPTRSPERAPDPDFDEDEAAAALEAEQAAAEEAAAAVAEPEPAPAGDDDTLKMEKRARRMGWVPKDEYRGTNPDRPWVSAEEFIENAMGNNRVLKERNEDLDRKLAATEAEVRRLAAEQAESKDVLRNLYDDSKALRERFVNADKLGYERGLRDAEQRMADAAANADPEAHAAAKADYDALIRRPPPAAAPSSQPVARPAPAAPAMDPGVKAAVESWVGENKWFNDDPELNLVAQAAEARLMRENPRLNSDAALRERLDIVRDEVMRRFPERFENPRRAAPSGVRTPSGDRMNGNRPGKKTVADLPAEARTALAKMKRTIKNFTDEEYLAHYDWNQ